MFGGHSSSRGAVSVTQEGDPVTQDRHRVAQIGS